MRSLAIALLFALAASAAGAQEEQAGRFTLAPLPDGALRLDTQTGAVSLCTGQGDALACRDVGVGPDATESAGALQDRIAALEARVAALEAAQSSGIARLPDEEDLDRVMALTDKMMRRFFGMVRDMRRDLEGETL